MDQTVNNVPKVFMEIRSVETVVKHARAPRPAKTLQRDAHSAVIVFDASANPAMQGICARDAVWAFMVLPRIPTVAAWNVIVNRTVSLLMNVTN